MAKIKLLFILLIGAVIFLPGCMLGPKYQRPEIDSPDAYMLSTSADSTINLKWWELFRDPELDTLIKIALFQNKDVRIAASRIDQARAVLGYTRPNQYPGIGYDGGASTGNFSGTQKYADASNNFFASANLQWEIDFWGKYRSLTETAKADLLASEFAKRSVEIAIISDVAYAYFVLLDYKERLAVAERTLVSRKYTTELFALRYEKGIIPELDLNQAQIQEAIAAASIPEYQRAIAQTNNALQILLGRYPQSFIPGSTLIAQQIPPEIPTGIPSSILERRPDILQAEQFVVAQNAQISYAQALRLPSISLTGVLGSAGSDLTAFTTGGLGWSAAGGIFGPIFNFGKNKKRVEIERYRTEEAIIQYESVVLQAFREVEDALVEVETYRRQVAINETQLVAAQNANRLSMQRYDAGVTSYLEVLDTERTLFSIEIELANTRQAYLSSYVKLYKALGGGWITPEEEQ